MENVEMTIGEELNGVNPVMEEEPAEEGGFLNNLPEFLTAKTGSGSVESYLDHPLNFNKSQGLARIIRGATGILGALDLAIIDIGLGLLEFLKGKKANV